MKVKTVNSRQLDIIGNRHRSSAREILAALLGHWRQKLGYCSIFAAVPAMLVANVQASGNDDGRGKPEANVAESLRFFERLNKSCSNPALLRRQSKFRLPHQTGNYNWLVALAGNDDCPGRPIPAGTYPATAPYIDHGDTTGANNTVTSIPSYFYYSYASAGPDHIYSFTLSGRGRNPQIQVSTTSVSYRPMIYVLHDSAEACPAGTGNVYSSFSPLVDDSRWSINSSTATLNSLLVNLLPLNVPLYLFLDSRANDANGAGPYTLRIQDVTIAPGAGNSIDSAEFFLRQHYLDFLNREPDPGGLAYWTNEIASCGGDATCTHRRRIGVSAAFFIEPEFQEAGYFVYRLFKASFNRRPNYTEFNSDRSRITPGANLEASKLAFGAEWVQRPAFLAAFAITMSNTEFVNKLFESAGLTDSHYDSLRQQEISAMNAGRSRAQVLRDVIEIPDFKNIPDPNDPRYHELKQISQYNPAFVLMQYFGYLRRDVDQRGYDFWLNVVNNQEPNNYRGMVCAFLTSREYQLRFGSEVTRSDADCAQ